MQVNALAMSRDFLNAADQVTFIVAAAEFPFAALSLPSYHPPADHSRSVCPVQEERRETKLEQGVLSRLLDHGPLLVPNIHIHWRLKHKLA